VLAQGARSIAQEEIFDQRGADCDLTTARKGKTMTKQMTGDSEVKRDRRKMKAAPQALINGENHDRRHE